MKSENKKDFKKFFSRVLLFVFIFFLFSVYSNAFGKNYFQIQNNRMSQEINDLSDQVFTLKSNGFVIKPSSQTQIGDRSAVNEVVIHIVKPGDTLLGLASKYFIKVKTLTDNNSEISQWKALKIGIELKILPVNGLLHTVKKNEDVLKIAKKYKVKDEDIIKQNKLKNNELIAGVEIIVPGAKKNIPISYYAKAPTKAPSIYNGTLSEGFIWPAGGPITQYYHRWHYAIDIAHAKKGPIFAASNGVVIKAQGGWNGGYGNMIIVDHGKGFKTLYAHNEKVYVKVGDNVAQGQTIAWMGNTGRVRGRTGIHLHFEIIQNGVKRNPLAYLGKR